MVLGSCRVDLLLIPSGDRESRSQFPREVMMKYKPVIYGLAAIVLGIALLVIYYFYLGSTPPRGQQPLVRLETANFESLKQSFNESKDSVRVMVMLSPT